MRICVIFNPAARGDKARRLLRSLDALRGQCVLKPTTSAGDARRLAAEAVREEFDTIVAAGGDGTLNDVLNGVGDTPDGLERTRLGVLPLGTVNVFARELGLPMSFAGAWDTIIQGRERRIDLPAVECTTMGKPRRLFFAQLAGAGLDARAIERVSRAMKKKAGSMAYVLAGLNALRAPRTHINVSAGAASLAGELVLIGNGRLYGGRFPVFPEANLQDGLLDVSVFPRANFVSVIRCVISLSTRRRPPTGIVHHVRAASLTLTGTGDTPVQVDGELAGHLPAAFTIQPKKLRVIVP